MPRGRRRDIYRLQNHALSDALGTCTGGLPHIGGYDQEWQRLLCPLCLDWFPFEGLDEDHAPQRAGQSALGPSHVVVMTCREDNHIAGRTFERAASSFNSLFDEVPSGFCPVHQRQRTTESGLVVVTDNLEFDLTNLRAAYLLAFVTLGHRWLLTPRLARIRAALRTGDLSHAATDYEILCAPDVDTLRPFHVYEVAAPVPAILVIGAKAGVLLPCHTSPATVRVTAAIRTRVTATVRATDIACQTSTSDRWEWPTQFTRPGGTPEKAWDDLAAASMFHYDRCNSGGRHREHALTRRELAALLPADTGAL